MTVNILMVIFMEKSTRKNTRNWGLGRNGTENLAK
jgi:hypothetical protein